jgi:mono/diheme cytochrome c family protein
MKSMKIIAIIALAVFAGAAVVGATPATIKEGKSLFLSEKYKCFTCHGEKGEGGKGPSFIGIAKKQTVPEMMKAAAHNCPPTGACSPKELGAIVDYLRTL